MKLGPATRKPHIFSNEKKYSWPDIRKTWEEHWQKNNPDTNTTTDGLYKNPLGTNIDYNDFGFFPEKLTIKQGATITFTNRGANPLQPASDQHPAHTNYPGSNASKCPDETGTIFDSCQGFNTGETWSFTFNEIGIWGYHNHLNASHFGKVVVE